MTGDVATLGESAPELVVSQWFNTAEPLTLARLRGRPVLVHALQMLCPGCVSDAIPQTQKAHALFGDTDLAVLGLHTVFEHHEAMTPTALAAFIHEYRLSFPIAVDQPALGPTPETMTRYRMQGTPTTLMIDRAGRLALHHFGRLDDMALGAAIASLLRAAPLDRAQAQPPDDPAEQDLASCSHDACTPR